MSAKQPKLLLYLSLFFSTALAIASGSISVIAAGIALYVSPKYAKDLFFVVAGLSALLATYHVWAEERTRRITAEDYLQTPDLKVLPLRAYRSQGCPWLLLEALVTNQSVAVAAVTNLACTVNLADAHVSDIGWTDVDPDATFFTRVVGTDQFVQTTRPTADLAKLLAVPLARGHSAQGYIQFRFEQLPTEGTELTLRLVLDDSLGGQHAGGGIIRYSTDAWFYYSPNG